MIKQPFFAVLLLLLPLSFTCQAQLLTERYIVELQQNGGSPDKIFSIKPDRHTLPGNASGINNKNGYARSGFLADDPPLGLGGYGVKTDIIESISWHLLYSATLLVGYKLTLTFSDHSPGAKTDSWLFAGVFISIGWLLTSYWNPDSPIFNPIGQPEANQDYPFAINTMMLSPEHNSKQVQRSDSSGQQASGSTTQLTGTIISHRHSDSGGSNRDPEQRQHTFGLNCYADNCNGVCQFRQSQPTPEQSSRPDEDFDQRGSPSPEVRFSFSLTQLASASVAGTSQTRQITTQTTELSQLGHRKPHCSQAGKVRALPAYRKRSHNRQLACDVQFRDLSGRPHSCGSVFNNANSLLAHKSQYHGRPQICDIPEIDENGRQRPCGWLFKNAKALSVHRSSKHTRQHICEETVVGANGQQRPCGRLFWYVQDLAEHIREYHRPRPVHVNRSNRSARG